jgi:hypothetical protein
MDLTYSRNAADIHLGHRSGTTIRADAMDDPGCALA